MKRSFSAVLASAFVLALAACGPGDQDAQIEPVEEVQPPPPPPPAPMTPDTLYGDTLMVDTLPGGSPGM
jgi:hypothetical protein